MNDDNYFSTKDIYLAATLIARGNTWYELKKRGKVFYFCFDKRQNQEKIGLEADNYWARNILLEPRALFEAMKELKSRMYNENEKR